VSLTDPIQSFILVLGEFFLFVRESVRLLGSLWRRRGLFLRQCESIGVSSLGVCSVAGIFMGAVLGFQLYISFHRFGAEALVGGSIGVALYREMGPVMTAIMVTGRAGASMAAEIASMRITEQIDALEVMAIDPIEYLVVPRVVAGLIMLPLLSLFFSAIGSIAAAGVACGEMGLQYPVYWAQFAKVVDPIEMVHCVTKAAVFGLILTWIGCFNGFRAYGGARAVGLATRNTVVASCLAILFADYILTSVLPFGFSTLKVL